MSYSGVYPRTAKGQIRYLRASHFVAMGLHSSPLASGAMPQCHTGEGHRWGVAPKILPSFFLPANGRHEQLFAKGTGIETIACILSLLVHIPIAL